MTTVPNRHQAPTNVSRLLLGDESTAPIFRGYSVRAYKNDVAFRLTYDPLSLLAKDVIDLVAWLANTGQEAAARQIETALKEGKSLKEGITITLQPNITAK